MSNVPNAVRKQLERAEELRQAQVAASSVAATPATDATEPAAAPQLAADQPAQAAAPSTPAPAEPATQQQPGEDWEHKYKVLQGIHQADVQRNRDLAAQNQQLRDLLARMQEAAKAQAAATPPAVPVPLVNQEETETYGAGLLDVTARKAREQYMPMIESLQATVANLERQLTDRVTQVERVSTVSAKDSFFGKLDKAVPYWEQLNEDAGFLSWLDSIDDLSGAPRRQLFNSAYQNFDDLRVAKFFSTYHDAHAPTPAAQTAQAPSMQPTVPLDHLVAPARSASAAPQVASKKVYSRSEVAAFYDNARKGAYRGREAERRQIEEDIFAAGREGRIQ